MGLSVDVRFCFLTGRGGGWLRCEGGVEVVGEFI